MLKEIYTRERKRKEKRQREEKKKKIRSAEKGRVRAQRREVYSAMHRSLLFLIFFLSFFLFIFLFFFSLSLFFLVDVPKKSDFCFFFCKCKKVFSLRRIKMIKIFARGKNDQRKIRSIERKSWQ